MPTITVITDPAVIAHRPSVAAWCRSGPLGGPDLEPLGAEVELHFPAQRDEVIAAVRDLPPEVPAVLVTRPGAHEDIIARTGSELGRVVWLELEAPGGRRKDARPLIRGRGVNGYHWAIRTAHWRWQRPMETIRYGTEPEHVGELRLPDGPGKHPIVVLMHGGYYREQWERDTLEPAAVALASEGWATWNIEYRRTGPGGDGGWPRTFEDIAASVDHVAALAEDFPIDRERVVVAGHSAGGHFALWAAGRAGLPSRAPGGDPKVSPVLAVSLAGVVDTTIAAERGVGFGHNPISALMEAMPTDAPERYSWTSPAQIASRTPQLLIQGTGGDDPDLIDINRMYAAAHPEATYIEISGADHFDITYPSSPVWPDVVAAINRAVP